MSDKLTNAPRRNKPSRSVPKRAIPTQWLRTILGTIYQQSTTTRADILGKTGLNAASASYALQSLIRSGVVSKAGEVQSKAGRRRDVLRLNPEAAYLAAIDLESSPIRFAITNLLGEVKYRWEEEVDLGEAFEMAKIAAGIEMVSRNFTRSERDRLLAVGISCPGIVDSDRRVTALNLGWRHFPLDQNLRSILPLPCFIQSAMQSFLMAERWLGRAQNCENCIYLEIGKGVGAGAIVNGQFLGSCCQLELGHITVDPTVSDVCRCGKTGCLESIASGPNVVRQYLERTGHSSNSNVPRISEVLNWARAGDLDAVYVVDRVARVLGLAISHLVALLSPELIILGGYMQIAEDLILPRLKKELSRHVCEWMRHCDITVSRLGMDIGLKGAASHAFYGIINDTALLSDMCRLQDLSAVTL